VVKKTRVGFDGMLFALWKQQRLFTRKYSGSVDLCAVISREPLFPMAAITALYVMKEGHGGAGPGLFMTNLCGDPASFRGSAGLKAVFILEKYYKKGDNVGDRLGQGAQFCWPARRPMPCQWKKNHLHVIPGRLIRDNGPESARVG
jgi:hypothetical protein